MAQALELRLLILLREAAVELGKRAGKQIESGKLRREGLRGCNADLDASARDVGQTALIHHADVATLQMVSVWDMPSSSRAWRRAANVSAVSPDWEIVTTSVLGSGTETR